MGEVNKDLKAVSSPRPSVTLALLPVIVLIGALYVCVVHFKELGLTSHVALIVGAIVAAFVALRLGNSWQRIEDAMVHGISLATKACLILLVIGMLVGAWIQSGIVPAMIFYGLKLLSPSIFLVASCVICSLVSLATGSSWSTAATVGIALIGVGEGLGVSRPLVAGAIISGAYFGDKMSPLSDTTNLAPAVSGANLFDHIRHMALTTGPSLLVALIGFALLGIGAGGEAKTAAIEEINQALSSSFALHPLLLVPPLLVIVMVIARVPALPAITGGWALGAVLASLVQRQGVGKVLQCTYEGFKASSGNKLVDGLLQRGGLSSMFSTVVLVVCAMSFGGVMESAGLLETLAAAVLRLGSGDGGLVLSTIVTCIGMNALASDQYLSVIVPGRMYRSAYAARGLAPKNLSRALEDSGTLTSALIPWNTCGAYMIATLGIKPWTYVPYCFLNLCNPIISVIYGFTGLTIARAEPSEPPLPSLEEEGSSKET